MEIKISNVLKWFKTNYPDVLPDKLQCIVLSQDATKCKISVEGRTLLPSNELKVLDTFVEFNVPKWWKKVKKWH